MLQRLNFLTGTVFLPDSSSIECTCPIHAQSFCRSEMYRDIHVNQFEISVFSIEISYKSDLRISPAVKNKRQL